MRWQGAYPSMPPWLPRSAGSQETSQIDLWRRTELGWLHASAGPGERLVLQAIGCELLVDEVYAGSQER
jgi:hypothetical protein